MLFDMETLEAQNRYKILASTVTPRPIAWVTTRSEDGVVNAAPYSFFNALGPHQTSVIGRILRAHIDDAVVQDKARCYIDTQALRLIGRMHGSGWYARCTDLFQMDRPAWAEWRRNGAAVGQLPSGEAP